MTVQMSLVAIRDQRSQHLIPPAPSRTAFWPPGLVVLICAPFSVSGCSSSYLRFEAKLSASVGTMERDERGIRWYVVRGAVLLFVIALLVLTLVVTTRKDTTNAETALWTFILFSIGFGASFYFGRQSVREAAEDVVRPQARAAARRLVTLGYGIRGSTEVVARNRRAAAEIADAGAGNVPIEHLELAYAALDVEFDMQIRMVVDALEDWRQFEPEIVNELLEQGDGED